MRPKQRIRLSLSLSQDAWDRLQRLFQSTDAESQVEVIRKALILYETVLELQRKGKAPVGLPVIS
jgi:hypothetical protein